MVSGSAAGSGYEDLAEIAPRRFADAPARLRERRSRQAFTILCDNTDDHARNRAAFWDDTSGSDNGRVDNCCDTPPEAAPRGGNEQTPISIAAFLTNVMPPPRNPCDSNRTQGLL